LQRGARSADPGAAAQNLYKYATLRARTNDRGVLRQEGWARTPIDAKAPLIPAIGLVGGDARGIVGKMRAKPGKRH
jgi:hypothetical protein